MSMAPNNPFENPQNAPDIAPPRQSSTVKGCLIGCAIAGAVTCLICCGGGYLLTHFSLKTVAGGVEQQLTQDPVILEHIGEIESLEVSLSGIIEEAQKAQEAGRPGSLVFDIEGSKGSGRIILEPNEDTAEMGMTLVMPDGTRHPIAGQSDDDVEMDFELNDFVDEGQVDPVDSSQPPPDTN